MLSIGTKKYRNLQEQVAYNTECIKKLDDYLDGITIEDKLVVIESDSGTFTDEELVILSGPLAFISNGSRVWMKDSETLVEFVYKAIDIKATEVGSAYFEIGGSKIVVNRETGAFNTSSDTIITTYNKAQIDSIVNNIMTLKANVADVYPKTQTYSSSEIDTALSGKANLSGASFTGDVSATKLSQTTPNFASNFNYSDQEGATIENIYNRFETLNNVLYCIINIKVTNNSGSSITVYQLSSGWRYINAIAPYITDLEGKKVSETRSGVCLICAHELVTTSNPTSASSANLNGMLYFENSPDASAATLMCRWNGGLSIPAGESRWVTGRLFLTLI